MYKQEPSHNNNNKIQTVEITGLHKGNNSNPLKRECIQTAVKVSKPRTFISTPFPPVN